MEVPELESGGLPGGGSGGAGGGEWRLSLSEGSLAITTSSSALIAFIACSLNESFDVTDMFLKQRTKYLTINRIVLALIPLGQFVFIFMG